MRSNMLQTYVCVSECERVCEGWKGAGGGFGAYERGEGSNERFSSSGRIVVQITNVSIL